MSEEVKADTLWKRRHADDPDNGWTYKFSEVENVGKEAAERTGYDYTLEVVEAVMQIADERLATLSTTRPSQPAVAREEQIEAMARAMCDRVNGQGDFDRNIGMRRAGWEAQARAGLEALLTREPLSSATYVEAETYRQMHDIAVNDLGYPSILEALEAAPHASAADRGDVLIGRFIAEWSDAAEGVFMDRDTAVALAAEFRRLASESLQHALVNGSWAQVIVALRQIKTDEEIRDELCVVVQQLHRWSAGCSAPRPTAEAALRKTIAEWIAYTPAPSPADVAVREADVAIWSGEHRAYWRKGADGSGAGYTTDLIAAGLWQRADAKRLTGGCGPEKLIALHERPRALTAGGGR